MSFSVVSYNILCDAYIRLPDYPGVDPARLAPENRHSALFPHIASLGADVLCLQEVEAVVLPALAAHLEPFGYTGHYAQKTGGRPDGCATFVKTALPSQVIHVMHYTDRPPDGTDSGHLALFVMVQDKDRKVCIVNTHIKYDKPGTPLAERWGWRQIDQLLREREKIVPACPAWIVCGDFNVTADNEIVRAMEAAGFHDAYHGLDDMHTCNSHQVPKRIDFLLHTAALQARPMPLAPLDSAAILPSVEEPSDHRAILAWFTFRR
jgi:mRNA deadenylase 3'-5' endonuclease subunit Ccr4